LLWLQSFYLVMYGTHVDCPETGSALATQIFLVGCMEMATALVAAVFVMILSAEQRMKQRMEKRKEETVV
jgi:hypothetical protein